MDSVRGIRKVLPNYLLDDYVASPDSKAASNHGLKSSSSHLPSAEGSQQHIDHNSGLTNGSTSSGDLSDASTGPFGILPRRKKLRQACVYCRRSHLVCEEKRPCHRCVKRGIADRCLDPPQEGQHLQDGSWLGGTETGPKTASVKESFISPPPPAPSLIPTNTELNGAESGTKRKRKAKGHAPHHHSSQIDSNPDYNRPPGGCEFTNAATSYASAHDHAHPIPSSTASTQGSSLSSAMPARSAASFAPIMSSAPIQAVPSMVARSAPSQLLQGQPIFQPPSSAELDSLFSTYFFDVADAFSARPNAGQHQGTLSSHPAGQGAPLFHPQQPHNPQGSQRHSDHVGSTLQSAHSHRLDNSAGSGLDQREFAQPHQALASHQQQQRQPNSMGVNEVSPATTSTSGGNSTFVNVAVPTVTASAHDGTRLDGKAELENLKAMELGARQKPGDVYAPYPYRKGYASLMRYMTEQNWSEQSIRSVEAALSKIRRLWFSLEDNIQPSSMIQLQAEWAGNVRYFSESVLPFTPVPMVVCRKAGEVYASNQLAQELCGRSRDQMTGGKLSCYELMTESSASKFFRLYELAVGGSQAEDGSYIPSVGNTVPLHWNAEIVRPNLNGSQMVVPTRGVFEMKIAPCGLPSLLVCCFVPLS